MRPFPEQAWHGEVRTFRHSSQLRAGLPSQAWQTRCPFPAQMGQV